VGGYFKAEPFYDDFLKKNSDCEKVLESMAWVQHKLGKNEETHKNSRKCLALNPHNRCAEYLEALYLYKNDKAALRESLTVLSGKYPTYYEIYLKLCMLSGEADERKRLLDKVEEYDPECAKLVLCRANVMMKENVS
jgi:tetratricopeptide (TPR) repeat protein